MSPPFRLPAFGLLIVALLLFSSASPQRERRGSRGSSGTRKRAATENARRIWPQGVIPYEMDPGLSHLMQTLIRKAADEWESRTCLRFVPVAPWHGYRVVFKPGSGCRRDSAVGKNSDRQEVALDEECGDPSLLLHELGHVVGFYDEQNRPDRDRHVRVLFENVRDEYQATYKKRFAFLVDSLGFPYDFDSVMHLRPSDHVTAPGKKSMTPVDPSVSLENGRKRLSAVDVAQTNELYGCPKCLTNRYEVTGTVSGRPDLWPPPEGEEEDEYCRWYVRRKQGEFVELVVDFVDIPGSEDCSDGFLEIRDGYWDRSPILGRFCGNAAGGNVFRSSANSLLIGQKKKRNSTGSFDVTYRTTCSGKVEADVGVLESPQFPSSYPLHPECVWIVTVSPGFRVFFRFRFFEMEEGGDCRTEYVEIRDGADYEDRLLGKFCGSELPPEAVSSDNVALVRYVTDGWKEKTRFSLSFVKETNECESPDRGGCSDLCVNTVGSYRCECLTGRRFLPDNRRCEAYSATCGGYLNLEESAVIASPLFPDNYPKNSDCVWKIANRNVLLTFLYFEVEASAAGKGSCYDKVSVSGSNLPEEEFCGFRLPPPLNLTETEDLRIRLTSDDSIETRGFAIRLDPTF
ncbi:tolloid-like protein 1 isoform X2 [Centruroides sculpturatus]|uniref:tolloid-like protein 1 isoform X2 n=1 Tax=Centruroides sculpturatus TaxID=218467 RepID=UPI000C6EC150|nr:tolloid-like protein 1 isoform X2 [Centruroides sculpturatus]